MATTTKKINVSFEDFKENFITNEAPNHLIDRLQMVSKKQQQLKELGFNIEIEIENAQSDWYEHLNAFVFYKNHKISLNITGNGFNFYLSTWRFAALSNSEKNDLVKKAGLKEPNKINVPTKNKIEAALNFEIQRYKLIEAKNEEKNNSVKSELIKLKEINNKVDINDLSPRIIYTDTKYFELKTQVCEGYVYNEIRLRSNNEHKVDFFKKLMTIK